MEIKSIPHGDYTEVIPSGRLDEYWASHLQSGLDQVIRGGVHRIRLNMSSVTYLSSAGIRILLLVYKQLREINGSFAVTDPSPTVRSILDLTRLSPVLIDEQPVKTDAAPSSARAARRIEHKKAAFEVIDYVAGGAMKCTALGDPALI